MKSSTKAEPIATIWCSSSELNEVQISKESFACWLHITKREWPEFEKIVQRLVEQGCTLIYTSGEDSKFWHDKADDCLIKLKRTEVLTDWGEETIQESAEVFWDLTWRYHSKRLLTIVDDAQAEEYRLAAEIIAALSKQFV